MMKVGTIGTGEIVKRFLDAINQIEGIDCKAMYSRKEETAKGLADKYHITSIYTDYDAFLLDDEINFVYIASPNSLHFEYALKALHKGKHVICEKPFTSTVKETKILIDLAKEKNLFLFEAITTLHLPNYKKMKELIPLLGDIKLVQCNYSQYSSRYDKFLKGEITNVFNPAFSGGSLVDINIYNLHFVTGLFGKAKEVKYFANIAKNGIDTSGIVILKYDDFICECAGAKDTSSSNFAIIQGTKGSIKVNSSVNYCLSLEINIDKEEKSYNEQIYSNNMVYELQEFSNIYHNMDYKRCYELLEHSLNVMEISNTARIDAGIIFDADL